MPDSIVRQIKILISSTRSDLAQYREKANEIIEKIADEKEKQVHLINTSMEKETQSGFRERPVAVSKRWVEEQSDWVVVIVAWNYGTITDEDGANGLSVTEWEYKHAIAKDKKVFVFVAGDPGDKDQYRVSEAEIEDLKDWRWGEQDDAQVDKINAFRRHLLDSYVDIFSNLQSFCEKLDKTLKNAIDDLLKPQSLDDIPTATPLAELIVEMTPDIRSCIQKVRLIADFKEIHDCLHEIRQQTIRPLQEQVLPLWTLGGTPNKKEMWISINRALPALGFFKGVRRSLDPDTFDENRDLCGYIDIVKDFFKSWYEELETSETSIDFGKFSKDLNYFARSVQVAFSEADRNMNREEGELRERYAKLLDGLDRTRRIRKLGPSEHQRLDDELMRVDDNRDRVKKALTTHHNWQEIHDKLYEIDCSRDTGAFDIELEILCTFFGMKLPKLVDEELKHAAVAEPENDATGPTLGTTVNSDMAVKLSRGSTQAFRKFVDNLKRLKEKFEALVQHQSVQAFDEMRKPFDDTFYFIDKRTLQEVEESRKRVIELEAWLDELAKRHRQTN